MFSSLFLCHIFSFQDLFLNKGYFVAFDEGKWEYESGSKYQRLLHLVQIPQPYPNMCLPVQVRIVQFLSSSNQKDESNLVFSGVYYLWDYKFKIIVLTRVTRIFAKVIRHYRYTYSVNNQTSPRKKLFGHAINH